LPQLALLFHRTGSWQWETLEGHEAARLGGTTGAHGHSSGKARSGIRNFTSPRQNQQRGFFFSLRSVLLCATSLRWGVVEQGPRHCRRREKKTLRSLVRVHPPFPGPIRRLGRPTLKQGSPGEGKEGLLGCESGASLPRVLPRADPRSRFSLVCA